MEKLRKMKTKKSVKKFLYEYQNPLQKWVFKSKSLNTKKKRCLLRHLFLNSSTRHQYML